MDAYFITFRSVTFAQRGEGVLKRKGVDCTLQRTPRMLEERGCGYCLRIRHQDVATAVALLQGQQVPYRRLYVHRKDGSMEELAL